VLYPALTIAGVDGELVLAVADAHSPTAAESSGDSLTIFFRDRRARDEAQRAVASAFPDAIITARDIDDEDWAKRSQESLPPVLVGALTVYPAPGLQPPGARSIAIVIQPSMGFGTGHHATTRLCLLALQREELAGRMVLDIGTGSGVLAIAAARLGAARATGIDNDPDAIQAARENLSLNPEAIGVTFVLGDVAEVRLKPDPMPDAAATPDAAADLATANLTGALLAREAVRILGTVRPGGRLIVSGLLADEREDVVTAFRPAEILWESREDEWVAVTFGLPTF
jgi:ribosomal protein L11 methyltransferase